MERCPSVQHRSLEFQGVYFELNALLASHAYSEMTPGPFFLLIYLEVTRGAGLGSSNNFHLMVCSLVRDGMWPLHLPLSREGPGVGELPSG